MDSNYLQRGEFRYICENYKFSCDDLKNYTGMEIILMKLYLDRKRSEGDNRDKNEIYIEWIKIYSEFFRVMYLMLEKNIHEGCLDN